MKADQRKAQACDRTSPARAWQNAAATLIGNAADLRCARQLGWRRQRSARVGLQSRRWPRKYNEREAVVSIAARPRRIAWRVR